MRGKKWSDVSCFRSSYSVLSAEVTLCQDLVSEFHSDDFCCSITMMKEAFWPHSHHKKKKTPENADTVLGIELLSLFWHTCQQASSLFKL